jgi:hypothetical protein
VRSWTLSSIELGQSCRSRRFNFATEEVLKSVATLGKEKGDVPLPENESAADDGIGAGPNDLTALQRTGGLGGRMPRRPRVFVEGGIYHVYNRFARGADLFSEPEEAIEFMEILRKARDRDDLRVYAWTVMPNHYHLALRAGPVPLSRTLGTDRETAR